MFTKWWMENSSLLKRGAKPALAALICASLIVAPGCALLPSEDLEETLPPINPPKLSQKPVYEVKTETLETKIRGSGRLMSLKEEEIFFTEDNKRIKEIYVNQGQQVQAGQIIAELDVTDLESQLKQRELQARQDELLMIEKLRKSDEMSAEELEKAKIDFELKREDLNKLRETVSKAKLTAPFSGTVVSIYVKKGDTVKAYDTIATVADLNQLTIATTINQNDLNKIAPGMEAVVDINMLGQFNGTIQQLPNPKNEPPRGGFYNPYEPQKDSINNYVLVKIDPFPEGAMRGTPLSVSVIIQRKENAIVIPTAALRTYAGRNYVQVEEKDGSKREVDVELGQQTSTVVEIVKGLQPGQKVVGR